MFDATFSYDESSSDVDPQLKKKKGDNKELVERIDIDEFLIKGGECGCFQIFVQSGLFLVLFPLVFPILLFYYIGYDPPWRCLYNNNNITHSVDFNKTCSNSSVIFPHDDGSRCDLDRSEWTFHYHKTTLVTEFDLVCNRSSLNALAGSIVFIGWAIGIVISGYLSDNYGRKWTMFIGFFVTTVLLFVSAFVNQIWQLIAVRFFIGLFFAAPALNTYVMVVEIVGPNRRVMATTMSHFCSVAAGIVLTIKAKFINEWKTLTMACSVPYLIGMVAVFCVPESVRWLNLKGRTKEAEAILRKAAKYNKKILPSVSLEPAESEEKHGRKASYIDLFKRWKLAKSMLAQGFIWFQCGMSTYALTWSFANLSGDMYKTIYFLLWCKSLDTLLSGFCYRRTVVGCFIVACIPKTEKLAVYRLVFGMTGFFMISNVFTVMYMWSSEIYPTVLSCRAADHGCCGYT
ncbi:solute carrier family 22 member 4-like isoform X2 [Hydractinia symbiolongicarpus]|uniref:solute carrier family 22 member 4-like isoform X2 n=1 Tax=Hydractinia symbiolongicarpus TaxID=13093 RepID=UPI00254A78AD|nr:solute carrier family 22 member 4-like isoform X2 [Hydractinia symbiolongicarpus]